MWCVSWAPWVSWVCRGCVVGVLWVCCGRGRGRGRVVLCCVVLWSWSWVLGVGCCVLCVVCCVLCVVCCVLCVVCCVLCAVSSAVSVSATNNSFPFQVRHDETIAVTKRIVAIPPVTRDFFSTCVFSSSPSSSPKQKSWWRSSCCRSPCILVVSPERQIMWKIVEVNHLVPFAVCGGLCGPCATDHGENH